MRAIKIILSLLFLCIAASYSYAQSGKLDESEWSRKVKGVDYLENRTSVSDEHSENEDAEFRDIDAEDYLEGGDGQNGGNDSRSRRNSDSQSSRSSSSSGDFTMPGWLSTFLLVIIAGLLLMFIVMAIVKNPPTSNKKVISGELNEDDLKAIEDNPFDNDLERLIHEAKQSSNHKLVIRLSFIYVLRLLSENGLIKWKKDKTNGQYLNELLSSNHHVKFRYLTFLFENVWYGHEDLSEETLTKAIGHFDSMIQQLKTLKKAS